MRYAMIMAGGSGTRLWPLSRKSRPKQLLHIFGQSSLLDLAVGRLRELVEPQNIYVLTNAAYAQSVRRELSELPPQNIIGEPEGRDTANAIGLAAAILKRRDPEAIMGVFTADHVIEPAETFRCAVSRAFELAEKFPQSLITFGIKPTWAHTGLGYIHAGRELGSPDDDYQAFKVKAFKEKPGAELAGQYCDSGQYYWNSGMFVWKAGTILERLREFLPNSYATLQNICKQWDSPAGRKIFERDFPTLEKISIDFAVMEKARDVIVVVLPCSWVDLGSWTALGEVLPADEQGNISTASQAELIDSKDNIIVCEDDHLLALIGLDNLVVVHSPQATLICRKDQVQQVKNLVAQLEQRGKDCL